MTKKRYVPRGSSSAFGRKKDPYKYIRDGKKQQVEGRANLPTARQKDLASYVLPSQESITAIKEGKPDAMAVADVGLSLLPLAGTVKPIIKGAKDMGIAKIATKLLGEASKRLKGSPKVTPTDRKKLETLNQQQVKGKTPTKTAEKQRKKVEAERLQNLQNKQNKTPVNKPDPKKTEAERLAKLNQKQVKNKPPTKTELKNQKKTEAQRLQNLQNKQNKVKPKTPRTPSTPMSTRAKVGTGVGVGAGIGGLGTYALMSEKNAKPAPGSQAGSSGQSVNPSPGGYQADPTSSPKITSKPKAKKAKKSKAKDTDTGYKFYGKKGTGLGDFSRKHGIQYATQKQFDKDFDDSDGEKAGGRPGRGKMKTQGMNRSTRKRSGFSGRGAGAALRGF